MTRDEINRAYHGSTDWCKTLWRGKQALKAPNDLLAYAQIIMDVKPTLIIETGTYCGGSAMFMADMQSLHGILSNVITIDNDVKEVPEHPGVMFIPAGSTEQNTIDRVYTLAESAESVLVVLDSEHYAFHVLNELNAYSALVTPGSYLIVEDTNLDEHPLHWDAGPGPWVALQKWLPQHPEFVTDAMREPFITFNPGGYLKKWRN